MKASFDFAFQQPPNLPTLEEVSQGQPDRIIKIMKAVSFFEENEEWVRDHLDLVSRYIYVISDAKLSEIAERLKPAKVVPQLKDKGEAEIDHIEVENIRDFKGTQCGVGNDVSLHAQIARTYFDQQYMILDTQSAEDSAPDAIAQAITSLWRRNVITCASVRMACVEYLKTLDPNVNWVKGSISPDSGYTFESLLTNLGNTMESGDPVIPFDQLLIRVTAEVFRINIVVHEHWFMNNVYSDSDLDFHQELYEIAKRENRIIPPLQPSGRQLAPNEFESLDFFGDWTATPLEDPFGLPTIEMVSYKNKGNPHFLGVIPN